MTATPTSPTPTGRVVLLGATGYTGELVARELVARGARPVLAGRSRRGLVSLSADLARTGPNDSSGDPGEPELLDTAVADVDDPRTVRALVGPGDVLVSTVGPFLRHGTAAVEAAVDARATYLDSTGEPAFIRRVVEEHGSRARRAGTALLTAFGHDWVPGNVAGALALQDGGADATRLEIGYFPTGGGTSGGTRSSALTTVLEPSYAWRAGRLRTERVAARVVSFDVAPGRRVRGVTAGGTEPFFLPALAPGLRDVEVAIGVSSRVLPLLPLVTGCTTAALRLPGVGPAVRRAVQARASGSGGGPDAARRATSRTHVVADARSASGELLRRVRLDGPDAYDLTARYLAWGAMRAAAGGVRATGALGPVQAFGLDALLTATRDAGMTVTARSPT
ncbi:saccharopine dehydrogenase family protein [Cellulosimicrobium marinum]|uniref:saccharopine dehydrogenase family protein n=1 Tax=Cellulosimicrobium marinum TaxID=1638992 RepID=UPI001E65E16F|nr:saccharopine dehydrogenase NADP-binding domain-containing protein [Cellulosimicrobium marinum]MCB7136045.1 saccharopine dehydrogenase NADP-binding domain-containing protein [Cellulosimicrobium marinum]